MSGLTLVKRALPCRTFIVFRGQEFEVIVRKSYKDENGTSLVRVQYVGDLVGHTFEIEKERLVVREVEAEADHE